MHVQCAIPWTLYALLICLFLPILRTIYTSVLSLGQPSHRKNRYDGAEEYYVVVKEKGQREEEHVEEETRKKTKGLEAG